MEKSKLGVRVVIKDTRIVGRIVSYNHKTDLYTVKVGNKHLFLSESEFDWFKLLNWIERILLLIFNKKR
jgi:hypothetical protein